MVILHSTETIPLVTLDFIIIVLEQSFKYVKKIFMSVTSVHFTQRSEANRPTSQRTISFLNKRNINKLPPVLTMASAPSYMVKSTLSPM